ncbi:MAG: zf-HC2 domain-containing protein [Demequinaceae bacterium]|nr:zf-HC2 domain-containing protein [Demequinaceae bacterium]
MLNRHVIRQLNLLIDGRLEREDALKAMAHLERCERCTAEWEALRRDREALQTSGSGIDMRSARKLLERERIAVLAQAEPRRLAKAATGVRPHVLKATVLVASGVISVLTILYILGEPKEIPLSRLLPGNTIYGPTVSTLADSNLGARDQVVAYETPAWLAEDMTPLGTIVGEDDGARVSQTTVLFGENCLTVTERQGRLPRDVGEHLERSDQGEREVFLLDEEGSGILFESGDSVITVGCDCTLDVLVGIVDSFPEESSPGILTRLGDGVGAVADAVTGG